MKLSILTLFLFYIFLVLLPALIMGEESNSEEAKDIDDATASNADAPPVENPPTSRFTLSALREPSKPRSELNELTMDTLERQRCPPQAPRPCSLGGCCRRGNTACCSKACCSPPFDKGCTFSGYCVNKRGLSSCRFRSGKKVAARVCPGGRICCFPRGFYRFCGRAFGRDFCISRRGFVRCAGKVGKPCSATKCCQLPRRCCGAGRCCR